jgi:hypothetical protein
VNPARHRHARSQLAASEAAALIAYQPQGATLERFHRSNAYFRCIIGPLGSGKTQAVIADILDLIDTTAPGPDGVRRSRWAAVRNTYPDLQTTTIADWKRWALFPGAEFKQSAPPTWTARYRRPDGTTVEAEMLFLAFDQPEDQRKARGLQLTGLWCNELKELAHTNLSQLMGRVQRYPGPSVPGVRYSVVCDTNAPDRDHWLARLAMQPPDGWEFFIQPGAVTRQGGAWRLNPNAENLSNLERTYYHNAIQGRSESWIRQNIANEFVFHADGRPVHPDFNERLHVAEVAPTPGMRIAIGFDFGRTPAMVVTQRQPDGRVLVLDELVTVNTSARRMGRLSRRFLAEKYDTYAYNGWGDPAGEQQAQTEDETPFDMLLVEGIEALPAPTNDFARRVDALDTLLREIVDGQPAIQIHPRCVTLIRGLAGAYQFRRVKVSGEDRYHDQPVKSPESHVCEALHYVLLGEGEGAVTFAHVPRTPDLEACGRAPPPGVGAGEMYGWAPPAELFE